MGLVVVGGGGVGLEGLHFKKGALFRDENVVNQPL